MSVELDICCTNFYYANTSGLDSSSCLNEAVYAAAIQAVDSGKISVEINYSINGVDCSETLNFANIEEAKTRMRIDFRRKIESRISDLLKSRK